MKPGAWLLLTALLLGHAAFVSAAEPERWRYIANERTRKKMDALMLRSMDLYDVPASKAIDGLRKMSIEFDTTEPDRTKRGLKIVVDLKAPGGTPPDLEKKRITISMQDTPIGEAIRYVAGLAGLKVRLSGGVIVLVPEDAPPAIVRREWPITEAMRSAWRLKAGEDASESFLLIDESPTRPQWVVSPDGKRLIGTGTEDQLDLIERVIEEKSQR